MSHRFRLVLLGVVVSAFAGRREIGARGQTPSPTPVAAALPSLGPDKAITETQCSAAVIGASIPASAIGEPVSAVTLAAPRWVPASDATPAYCSVDGAMAPVDTHATARPINFRVILPAAWNHRSAEFGGGGMNGVIPNVTGPADGVLGGTPLQRRFVTYGSDSGHQSAAPGRGSAAPAGSDDWTLNDEAMKNLGYAQMKKTHDAAMAIVQRAYGERPRFSYYIGTSQGGREALTVAQRYPADYDGIIANVPIVNFSSLMLAPELIRIQEKPRDNWVTRAKVNAIRGEFMRQCDGLDGLVDGVINNYMACRALFDVTEGATDPWAAKRCPNNTDPNPTDTTDAACFTNGEVETLRVVYSRYQFATPLANGVRTFGMWVPNTDPAGSGLIADVRYRGQEGAADNAPIHTHLGVLGVTGFLMQNLAANPLNYTEGGLFEARRHAISQDLDSMSPHLDAFAAKGGKMIVTIGTDDTLASPGSQLDYYQSVIDTMGRARVDTFARFFVIPQVNHGLRGTVYTTDGNGKTIPSAPIANAYDRLGPLVDWVERKVAPPMSLTVSSGDRTMPLCSYPTYPRYTSGPPTAASSYSCTAGR